MEDGKERFELFPTDKPNITFPNLSFGFKAEEKRAARSVASRDETDLVNLAQDPVAKDVRSAGVLAGLLNNVWESSNNFLNVPGEFPAAAVSNPTTPSHQLEFYQQQWVKIDYHPKLSLKFYFSVSPQSDVKGLTFIHASSGQDLHELLYRKFKQDPNVSFTRMLLSPISSSSLSYTMI